MNERPTPVHPSFRWLRSHPIPSLQVEVQEFEHINTGAMHYHLAADNDENVFMVALRTLPMDSTGVAHILEHTALCGSERFPVRDPFFMMIRRSLNTFMNAFTSSDCTAYPFASKNRKDFDNLLQVYMDAVFFSNLDELDFAQEGHRLAFTEDSNPDSALQFKGVVYNEMKGAMSSPTARLWQTLTGYLFPHSTYHYNSGGEPAHIPDLTYQQLRDFYKTHYHPSNAIFMTYGNIPASDHQQQFEALALHRFERLPISFSAADEKRYLAPIRVEESYAVDDADTDADADTKAETESGQTHVVVGWLLGKSTNLDDLFRAQLLSAVLLDNSASPLLAVLETSELGKAPSPLCGLEDSNQEMSFICGLEGCEAQATLAVEALILQTLQQIANEGVDSEQVEAALHQLELSQREISGDSWPYGLQLLMSGLSTAVHRGDPIRLLDIEPALAQLREDIKDPEFIPKLIHNLLLDNCHRVTLTLRPDSTLADRENAAERARLTALQASMTDAQKAQIVELNQRLNQRQMQQDDPDVLPKVGLEDVPAELPELRSETVTVHNQPLTWYAQGTNGLAYQQIIVDLPHLDDELLDVLPWYTTCVSELGIGQAPYTDVQARQAAVSGGINCYASVRGDVHDAQQSRAILVLSSKALTDRFAAMSQLLHDTFFQVRFDEGKRIRELLEQILARQLSSVTSRGHSMAVTLAASAMSPTARLSHRFTGLEGISALKRCVRELAEPQAQADLLDKFRRIHIALVSAPRRFLLIGEAADKESLLRHVTAIWPAQAGTQPFSPLQLPPVREKVQSLWTCNTQVNFCARAYPTVPGGHPDHPALCVLAGMLRNAYLHRAVREQGGAYGAGAEQDAGSASFRFYSYRDPRLQETLHDFDASVDWLLHETHSERLVEEAILGVISGMDRSVSPAGSAKQDYYNKLFGRDRASRMAFRKAVLSTGLDDLRRVAAQYLRPDQASTGVVAGPAQKTLAEAQHWQVRSI